MAGVLGDRVCIVSNAPVLAAIRPIQVATDVGAVLAIDVLIADIAHVATAAGPMHTGTVGELLSEAGHCWQRSLPAVARVAAASVHIRHPASDIGLSTWLS